MNNDIKSLAESVYLSIQVYSSNFIEIANNIKNLTINISNSLSIKNNYKEIMKTYKDLKNNDIFILFKIEKNIEKKRFFNKFYKNKKIIFKVNYIILSPENDIALNICNYLLNSNIKNKIDYLKL